MSDGTRLFIRSAPFAMQAALGIYSAASDCDDEYDDEPIIYSLPRAKPARDAAAHDTAAAEQKKRKKEDGDNA